MPWKAPAQRDPNGKTVPTARPPAALEHIWVKIWVNYIIFGLKFGELRDINQSTEGRAPWARLCGCSGRGNAAGNDRDINLMGGTPGWEFMAAAKDRLADHEETETLLTGDAGSPCTSRRKSKTCTMQEETQIYPKGSFFSCFP